MLIFPNIAGKYGRVTDEDDYDLLPFGVEEDVGRVIGVRAAANPLCPGVSRSNTVDLSIELESQNSTNVWFYADKDSLQAYVSKYTDEPDKSETGYPWMRSVAMNS